MRHPDHHHRPRHGGPDQPGRDRQYRLEGPGPEGGWAPMGGPRGRGRGFGPRGGPGFGRGRGGRARGDIRAAVLLLLAEQPRHGYELIQKISELSAGSWAPSPGSIYPTLQVLEDEGLITIESVDGRKTASLTEQGIAYVEAEREALGSPWSTAGDHDHGPALALRQEIMALKDAVAQVARVGSPAQHTAAAAVLVTARKDLYRLLAADDES